MKKKVITKPFDREKIPPRQNFFLTPLIWALAKIATAPYKLKIKKVRMKGLKGPFIVFGTHMSFTDFMVTPLALFPRRANYISELEGFENYGEWLYRQVGCLGTRKFVNDMSLIRNIKKVLERNDILVLYPEARYANVGTFSKIPESVGKLVKMLGVPVVTINMKGNYLQSPIWNLKMRKGVRLEAEITQLFTADELAVLDASEINSAIEEKLTYDEYAWQFENKIKIDYKKRAEGIEKVLYQCPCCEKEFNMQTSGSKISCKCCGVQWEMTEYGKMECLSDVLTANLNIDFSHIPNWYEWQRSNVCHEIDIEKYNLDIEVQIDSLPNAINFIDLGIGRLKHNKNGYSLTFTEYGDKKPKTLTFSPLSMTSVHTECDYRGKGECITLSTTDNTYFIFPKGEGFNNVKIQFATEYLYELNKAAIKNQCMA